MSSLLGCLQYSDPEYHALWRAAKGVPVQVPALKDEVAKLRLGIIKTHLLQAARAQRQCVKMVNGTFQYRCHPWVVFSSWVRRGRAGFNLKSSHDLFPGAKCIVCSLLRE